MSDLSRSIAARRTRRFLQRQSPSPDERFRSEVLHARELLASALAYRAAWGVLDEGDVETALDVLSAALAADA